MVTIITMVNGRTAEHTNGLDVVSYQISARVQWFQGSTGPVSCYGRKLQSGESNLSIVILARSFTVLVFGSICPLGCGVYCGDVSWRIIIDDEPTPVVRTEHLNFISSLALDKVKDKSFDVIRCCCWMMAMAASHTRDNMTFYKMSEEPHEILGARQTYRKDNHQWLSVEVKPPYRQFDLNKFLWRQFLLDTYV